MKRSINSNDGIGFFSLLVIVFITLKLTGFISWSWLWIVAPLWIGLVLCCFILVIGGLTLWGNR